MRHSSRSSCPRAPVRLGNLRSGKSCRHRPCVDNFSRPPPISERISPSRQYSAIAAVGRVRAHAGAFPFVMATVRATRSPATPARKDPVAEFVGAHAAHSVARRSHCLPWLCHRGLCRIVPSRVGLCHARNRSCQSWYGLRCLVRAPIARPQSENDENEHPSVSSLQLSVKHLKLLIRLASDEAFRAYLIESSTERKRAVDFLNQGGVTLPDGLSADGLLRAALAFLCKLPEHALLGYDVLRHLAVAEMHLEFRLATGEWLLKPERSHATRKAVSESGWYDAIHKQLYASFTEIDANCLGRTQKLLNTLRAIEHCGDERPRPLPEHIGSVGPASESLRADAWPSVRLRYQGVPVDDDDEGAEGAEGAVGADGAAGEGAGGDEADNTSGADDASPPPPSDREFAIANLVSRIDEDAFGPRVTVPRQLTNVHSLNGFMSTVASKLGHPSDRSAPEIRSLAGEDLVQWIHKMHRTRNASAKGMIGEVLTPIVLRMLMPDCRATSVAQCVHCYPHLNHPRRSLAHSSSLRPLHTGIIRPSGGPTTAGWRPPSSRSLASSPRSASS